LQVTASVGTTTDAGNDALTIGKNIRRKVGLSKHRRVAFEREQLFDKMRHRQHGRPHVEREPLRTANIGAAADIVELFNNPRVEAEALQADRA
jgi:hypothetical protein